MHLPRRFRSTAVLLCLWLLPAASGWAAPRPMSTRFHGVVRSVDPAAHTLILQESKDTEPVLVVWKKHTKFTENGQPAAAPALKVSTVVDARYQEALFVRNELLYVAWLSR